MNKVTDLLTCYFLSSKSFIGVVLVVPLGTDCYWIILNQQQTAEANKSSFFLRQNKFPEQFESKERAVY